MKIRRCEINDADNMLKMLLELDKEYSVGINDEFIIIKNSKIIKKVYIYPAMWNIKSKRFEKDVICISDKMITKALPKSYNYLINSIIGR